MNAENTDKRFYEKKWMSIGKWERQKAPYLKKSADIEGLIARDWIILNYTISNPTIRNMKQI